MFEDSTFESMGIIHTRTSGWMMATLALNGTVLLALVLLPLLYPQMLPSMVRTISMTAPPPPVEPVHLQTAPANSSVSAPQITVPAVAMQRVIPTLNPTPGLPTDTSPLSIGNPAIGENPIGASNDPFGNGSSNVRVVQSSPRAPASISGGVMNGLLIFNPKPIYPPIARATHTAGTVVLEAVISKTGSIENLRVVSGSRMLQQAALDAVRQWRYRPYMLDGQPVEVETTVNVVFTLD